MFTAVYIVLPHLWPEKNLFKDFFFLLASSLPVILSNIVVKTRTRNYIFTYVAGHHE